MPKSANFKHWKFPVILGGTSEFQNGTYFTNLVVLDLFPYIVRLKDVNVK